MRVCDVSLNEVNPFFCQLVNYKIKCRRFDDGGYRFRVANLIGVIAECMYSFSVCDMDAL